MSLALFVLAMTFRGFVIEGFVIPTGSMAPTLRGMHLQKHSNQTWPNFAVGFAERLAAKNQNSELS